jgi:hypothetical protein
MSTMHKRCVLGGSIFLLLFGVALPLRGQDTAAASGSPDTIAAAPGPPDATLFTEVTGDFCTSGSEREITLKERWYANQEIQAGADCDAATAD